MRRDGRQRREVAEGRAEPEHGRGCRRCRCRRGCLEVCGRVVERSLPGRRARRGRERHCARRAVGLCVLERVCRSQVHQLQPSQQQQQRREQKVRRIDKRVPEWLCYSVTLHSQVVIRVVISPHHHGPLLSLPLPLRCLQTRLQLVSTLLEPLPRLLRHTHSSQPHPPCSPRRPTSLGPTRSHLASSAGMTSYITKKVGRRIAGQNLAQYEPADPHYGAFFMLLIAQSGSLLTPVSTNAHRNLHGCQGEAEEAQARGTGGAEQARRTHPRALRLYLVKRGIDSRSCPSALSAVAHTTWTRVSRSAGSGSAGRRVRRLVPLVSAPNGAQVRAPALAVLGLIPSVQFCLSPSRSSC